MSENKESPHIDVEEEALEAAGKLLPPKFHHMYENEYARIQKWKTAKITNSAREKMLVVYYSGKSKKGKPSTLCGLTTP